MFDWLFRRMAPDRSVATQTRRARFLRAKYDSALTTDNNRRHWSNADGLSASAANGPEVRRILRNRARYEVANNSYARGIILTLAKAGAPDRRFLETTRRGQRRGIRFVTGDPLRVALQVVTPVTRCSG